MALPSVATHDDGAVSCEPILWRFRGRVQLSIVVKALFSIVCDGVATHAGPAAIQATDEYRDGHPARSLEAASNLAPYLARCDVLFIGHAYPPGGPAPTSAVRLGIARDGRPLLDKTLHVFGDRGPGNAGPEPFARMPIAFEQAYGGLGEDNPTGKAAPNLVDPKDPRRPASFGPISRYWPPRKRLLAGLNSKEVDAKVADIPEAMPWAYFQAAPPDQQIEYLVGGEWIVLDGLHPTLPRVQTRLPRVAGAARVAILKDGVVASETAVELACDTLAIDGDQQTFSLTWRGRFEVPGGDPPPSLAVLAALEARGAPVDWGRILASHARPSSAPDAPSPAPAFRPTALAFGSAPKPATLPFASSISTAASLSRMPSQRPAAPKAHKNSATVEISLDDVYPAPDTLPFAGSRRGARSSDAPPAGGIDRDSSIGPAPAFSPSIAPPPETVRGEPAWTPSKSTPPARAATRHRLGMDIVANRSLAVDVTTWGVTPARDLLTVIAKATCDLVPDAPAAPRAEADAVRDEGPLYPSDLAPYKVRADVVLVGHAVATGGAATSMAVGVRFGGDGNAFSRSVLVFGDRAWRKRGVALEPSPPEAFATMPVIYQRAFGGPRYAPNPVGMGHRNPMRRGPAALPNLEDPEELLRSPAQSAPPATFAPIPLAWKDAWSSAGDGRVCLADKLDWTRYQIAPPAQQLAFLSGDEHFAITGFSLRGAVTGSLPGLRAQCFALHGATSRFEEVRLELDTVVFDLNAMRVDLVWRGALAVTDETAPDVAALYLFARKLGAEMSLEDARAKLLPS